MDAPRSPDLVRLLRRLGGLPGVLSVDEGADAFYASVSRIGALPAGSVFTGPGKRRHGGKRVFKVARQDTGTVSNLEALLAERLAIVTPVV